MSCYHQEILAEITRGLVTDFYNAIIDADKALKPFGLTIRACSDEKGEECFDLIKREHAADPTACPILRKPTPGEIGEVWKPTTKQLVAACGPKPADHLAAVLEIALALNRLDVCHHHGHEAARLLNEKLTDLVETSGPANMPPANA